jgi:hypothetical protein
MRPEREGFDRYLEDTIVVDWQTPAVLEKARALCQGHEGEADRVRAAFEFVRDEIAHSLDAGREVVTCTASQVLREGTGLCHAKSHLLAALLRARGIPAGFAYQRLRSEESARGFALHGLVAAWFDSLGRWVLLDPRGDNDEVRTEFRIEPPSLAYTPDPERGEASIPTIFARPAPRVVDLLDRADRLSQIIRHLPDDVAP